MAIFLYDRTFEGFLSSVFYSYEMKIVPEKIISTEEFQDKLFIDKHVIYAEVTKADRVWKGLRKKASETACQMVYRVFVSEVPDTEMLIYNYIRLVIDSPHNIENDFSNEYVTDINNLHKKIAKEAQRILQFTRFQKTSDDIYFASFEPLYNVLPFAVNHFKNRFADQKWILYDIKRKFGFFYDLNDVRRIEIKNSKLDNSNGKIESDLLNVEEDFFKKLWKNYFDSINIKERKNLKVHMQFLPKRYWKYLPEKDIL